MAKKKVYILLSALVILIAGYFIVGAAFPKELSRFPIFVLVLLLDIYLWYSIRKWIYGLMKVPRIILTCLYWLPLVMVVLMGLLAVNVNIYLWKPQLATLWGGTIFIIYSAKLVTILFFLLADLIKIIRHVIRFSICKKRKTPCEKQDKGITRGKFLKIIGLASGALVFSGMIIGAVRWAYDYKFKRDFVRFPMLPKQLDGVKMIQISDLHLGSWSNKTALLEAVEEINAEEADFIFFTGDLVNFLTKEAYIYKHTLSQLKARFGVFAVLGNHDYGDYVRWDSPEEKEQNLRDLEILYKEMGWHLLRNESMLAKVNNIPIAIVGVENWSAYDRFPKYGDLDKALEGTEMALFKILLSHDPTHWDNIVSQKYPDIGLTLSGHTHGFQFGVEFKNFKWSPAQYMYKRWAGLYSNPATDTPQYLYVNRGLGMIGYPGRIGILPEITVLELTN